MWLITSLVAAIVVTAIWAYAPKRYKLDSLSLMLWGLALMVLVDHVMGYAGGGFVEMETDGLIKDGTVLGIAMLIPIFIVWAAQLLIAKQNGELITR
jgi:hypothetical protein